MKILRYSLLFTVLAFTALSVNAGEDWKALDVGNFTSAIFNTAVVGYPQSPTSVPSGWWPAGTNDSYIFEGDIWIGAKRNGEIGVAESDGRQSEIWPINHITDEEFDPEIYETRDEVYIRTPGVTTKGTRTSQAIRFKCTDANAEVNKGVILDLELEVNGFQWSYAPLYDFFILEYNVKNVGSDTLEDVFMAFRYDVDISSNETGTANYSGDDFVALDQTPDSLNPEAHPNRFLSYGYSNGSAPGYIGLRVLDAYIGENAEDETAKIPFAAHKRITIDTDPTTDAEMYALISIPGVEPVPENYDDQRFIQSYGPVESLAPGETFNVIIVVAIGEGLEGLQVTSDEAQKLYDDDYSAAAPPPSPKVTAYPANKQISLLWSGEKGWINDGVSMNIEDYADPFDPDKVFEGYRVYRLDIVFDENTGKPVEDWKLLTEFDKSSVSNNFFTVDHVGVHSDATIEHMGDEPVFANFFESATYAIKFNSSTEFEVINTTLWEVLAYNPDFPSNGGGYVVVKDPNTGEPYPDGTYRSGEQIYFGGLYVKITDGPGGPPVAGDIFQVVATASQALGEDVGIKNFYTDTGLTNGIQYTYAVTSYDTGNPENVLPSMESSQIETMVHVVPRAHPAGYKEPIVELVPNEALSVTVEPMVLAPDKVTGHQYKIVWYGAKQTGAGAFITGPGYQPPAYEIVNTTTNQTVVEKQTFDWYDPLQGDAVEVLSPMFDGIILKLTGVNVSYDSPTANSIIDVKLTEGSVPGWTVDIQNEATGGSTTTGPNIFWITYYRPHTYSITFVDDTHIKIVDEDTDEEIPFNSERADGYAILSGAGWSDEYVPADTPGFIRIFLRGAYVYISDPNGEISEGDVFTVEMGGVSAPQNGDEQLLTTEEESLEVDNIKEDLARIRVVPNPYFVTNKAENVEGSDKIFFKRLPPRCTIRIYTLVGELVREIKHESTDAFNPDERLAQGSKGGTAEFDLLNRYNQALASGVYIFHVEAQDENSEVIGNKVGRFAIIR